MSEDETVESYEWFFNCVLHATNHISPTCLFSDSNPTLIKAVVSKIPNIHHFLYIFHIQENLRKNLASKLRQDYKSFYKNFLNTQNSLLENDFYHC